MASAANSADIWRRAAAKHELARQAVEMWQRRCRENPSKENVDALHAAVVVLLNAPRFPSGFDVILARACPIGAQQPITCFVCSFGHLTECHYPHYCAAAECSHSPRE